MSEAEALSQIDALLMKWGYDSNDGQPNSVVDCVWDLRIDMEKLEDKLRSLGVEPDAVLEEAND